MTNQTRAAWLAGLQIGDEVAVESCGEVDICNVTGAIKGQVAARGIAFVRATGVQVGTDDDSYGPPTIYPVTGERRTAARRTWLLRTTDQYSLTKLTDDQLERIVAIMREGEAS